MLLLLNNQRIIEEIKEENSKYLETKENKSSGPKPMGYSKTSSKKEVYSGTVLPQETRKISSRKPNLTPKTSRERRTNKT